VSRDSSEDGSHKNSLRVNSLALSGIRNKHDVFLLSDQRRECLKRVLKAAEFLVASIGGGEQAVDGEYGEPIGLPTWLLTSTRVRQSLLS
jgi:hypothetical protein